MILPNTNEVQSVRMTENPQSALADDMKNGKTANFEVYLNELVEQCLTDFNCMQSAVYFSGGNDNQLPKIMGATKNGDSHFDVNRISPLLVEWLSEKKEIINLEKIDFNRLVVPELAHLAPPKSGCLAVAIKNSEQIILGFILVIDRVDKQRFSLNDEKHIKRLASTISHLYQYRITRENLSTQVHTLIDENRQHLNEIVEMRNQLKTLTRKNEDLEAESIKYAQTAQYDKLTGLYNRAGLEERLNWLIDYSQRSEQNLAVALLDLDHFKQINDTLGHEFGDQLLQTVAARIRKSARTIDTIGRLGGDEFVIIINNVVSQSIAFDVLQRIINEIALPIPLAQRVYEITCSIGFSIYPQDGKSSEELLHFADSAMYQAKKNGRANFQYYSAALQVQIQARLLLESELVAAIKNNEFVLYYQPQVDLHSGLIVGLEALIRWQHPTRGLLLPNDFIGLAEEIGLIIPIGDWIFQAVCQQISQWQQHNQSVPRVAINLSVKQLTQPDLISYLTKIIEKHQVNANLMTIEITESLSLDSSEDYIETLQALKDLGFYISIDDFGTGYSNLSYLKRFPVDELKIDKAFIDNITSSPHDKAIAKTIIAIAHSLGFKVVAEGVETRPQLALLAKEGCDIMQGYYYHQALAVEPCTELLLTNEGLNLEGILPSGYQRCILLVDDNQKVLSSIQRMLRQHKINVLTATNAQDALEILALNDIGVVLSDISMPNVSGIELLDRVYQMYPKVVRMILSGQGEFELACEAINKSAIHKYIIKPWKNAELKQAIDAAFLMHEKARES